MICPKTSCTGMCRRNTLFEEFNHLRQYYLGLICGSALQTIEKINIIIGPYIIFPDKFEETIRRIRDGNLYPDHLAEIYFLLKLKLLHPSKIEIYLKRPEHGPELHPFVVHSKNTSLCLVKDAGITPAVNMIDDQALANQLISKTKEAINNSWPWSGNMQEIIPFILLEKECPRLN